MRRLSVTTLMALAVLILAVTGSRHAAAQGAAAAAPVKVGAPAPGVTLTAADGHAYRLADLHGKRALVLVIFRGVW
ncbi:MAG TPA: hypothetical protein VMT19_13285 [Thermoanaerobaculaceae bacterium]|nr:hypothetical protein [Thermoanaerobaculaceae bacterium]